MKKIGRWKGKTYQCFSNGYHWHRTGWSKTTLFLLGYRILYWLDPLLVGSFIGWIHMVETLFVFVAISANIGMVDHSILVVCHREQKPNTISTGIWYIYWRLPLKFVGKKIPWWLYWAKTTRLLDNLWNVQGERTRVVRPGEGELVEG